MRARDHHGAARFSTKRINAEQGADRKRPRGHEMLVRQIAVVGGLRVSLLRRVDHPVLLHQYYVIAEQHTDEREERRIRRQPEEGSVLNERAAGGELVADLFETLAAKLVRLFTKNLVE